MNQSTILIIAIILVLLVFTGVAVSMMKNNVPIKASLFSAHRMLDNKDIKKYISDHDVKLNHPNNLLYPEILTMLPAGALVHITPETMADTNILVDIIMSKISLSSVEQLKNLSPAVIMAMNAFQLSFLDKMLIGQNNDYAPLDALVPQTLSVDQAKAFIMKVTNTPQVLTPVLPPVISPSVLPQVVPLPHITGYGPTPIPGYGPTPLVPGMPLIRGITVKY